MGHPVARLEIDGIQRPAPAAPVIAAAAQEAQPPLVQRGIAHAAFGAGIHFLDAGIEIHAAGFQQQDFSLVSASASASEMPAGPPPMMARSGVKHGTVGKRAGVDQGGQSGMSVSRAEDLEAV